MTGITLNIEVLIAVLLSLLLVNVFLIKWMFSQYRIEVDDHESRLRLIERSWITAAAWHATISKYSRDLDEIRDDIRDFKNEMLAKIFDHNRRRS